MLMVRLASKDRVASGFWAHGLREGAADRLDAAVQALGEAGVGETRRVAPRRGGGDTGHGHDVGDREKASLGKQISDDFSALSLAHGPSPFPRNEFR